MSDLREQLTEAGNKFDGHVTNGSIEEQMKIIQPLITERDELDGTLELIRKADMRALKMWQEAHPGNDHVWSDQARLVVWLLERQHTLDVAVIREALDAIEKIAEADIAKGNPITGAHHRAIQEFRKLLDDKAGSS